MDTVIEIREVKNRKELKKYIFLPGKLHQNHSNWVPPIYSQEWKYFNSRKNRAFSYSDCIIALAYLNNSVVGRIMGIINKRGNEIANERNARFGYLECPDNQEIAHALLSYIEKWAKEKGMNKIVGPMGFSNQDPQGFMIQGFEHKPTISTNFNFDYMNRLLASEHYSKEADYVVYKIDVPEKMPEFYQKIYSRIISRGNYEVAEFNKRKQLKPFIIPILELMNECFIDLYGYQPLDYVDMKNMGKRFVRFLDPRFVKVVKKDDQLIGFNIAMPNLSEGLRKAKGRLFPVGLFHIMNEAKRSRQLDTLLGGIKEEYRGRGIDVMMGYKTILEAQKAGFEFADSHLESEDNTKVRAEMERLGGEIYKRYRIYSKDL
ncbi:MAG: hypothetical protein JW965_07110 [Bacteroidales bacterium]|nr:hypothetical protein [Bacteroidales bacterium]